MVCASVSEAKLQVQGVNRIFAWLCSFSEAGGKNRSLKKRANTWFDPCDCEIKFFDLSKGLFYLLCHIHWRSDDSGSDCANGGLAPATSYAGV
jgi:hypothetical protein